MPKKSAKRLWLAAIRRRRKETWSIAFPIFLVATVHGVHALNYEGKIKFKRAISEVLSSSAELRFKTDGDGMVYRHFDIGAQIQPLESWRFATHFRAVDKKPNDRHWLREERLYFQAEKLIPSTKSMPLKLFVLRIRNRLESRWRENKEQAYRYRLRFKVKAKRKLFGRLTPFISNDFYYDLQQHEYNINRFDIGVDLGRFRKLEHSLYVKFKSKRKDSHWATEASLVYKLDI